MMSLSLDEPRPIDSRGRASPPGEASSGELSGEFINLSGVAFDARTFMHRTAGTAVASARFISAAKRQVVSLEDTRVGNNYLLSTAT